MYLSVQEQEEANSVFKRFETRPSCVRPVCTEHRAWMLNWALSHLFLLACLNCDLYLFVLVAGGRGELGLSVRRVLCLNALNSFECLNWQGLKTRANDKLSWQRSSGPSPVLIVFLGWPQPVGWDHRGASPQPWAPIIVTTFHPQ